MRSIALPSGACAVLLGACALSLGCAHDTPAVSSDAERLRPQWEALDSNGDGQVRFEEIPAPNGMFMRASDLDRDGALSLDEFVAFDLDPGGGGRIPLPENVALTADIPYAANEDPRQQVDVYLPKQKTVDGPLPVIAYVHGGAWRMGSRVMARGQVAPHVASGRYAAVSIGYRLTWQDPWPAQVHDAKAGIRWIRANAQKYGFDTSRICVMGSSAGGHLAAELGTTNGLAAVEGAVGPHTDQSSDVQCAVDFFGPTDLTSFEHRQTDTTRSAMLELFGGPPEDKPQLTRNASPLFQVDPRDPPFLIVHGTKDPLVPYSASVDLAEALEKAGVPVVLQKIDGGGHGDFFGPEIVERVRSFLERTFYDPTVVVPDDVIVFQRASAKGSTLDGMPPGINERFLDENMDVDRYVGIFEGESRAVFAEREAVVASLRLEPGDRIADIGAGTGFFAALFDREVGKEGAVFAVEISPKFLEHLRARVESEGLIATRVVEGTDRSVELAENSIDMAFICDVYHHFEHPPETLASLRRALRPGGSLVLIDFKRIPGESDEFILEHVRAGQEVFAREIEAAGFVLRDEIALDRLDDNYILRFTSPPDA